MSVVIEAQASLAVVQEGSAAQDELSSSSGISSKLPMLARLPLRQAKQRWNCSLDDRDLQCLLRIIEVDLVPQLLTNYSPARCAPDDRLNLG